MLSLKTGKRRKLFYYEKVIVLFTRPLLEMNGETFFPQNIVIVKQLFQYFFIEMNLLLGVLEHSIEHIDEVFYEVVVLLYK